MELSRKRIVFWACIGVYVIGAVVYLTGLGAFDMGAAETTEPTMENGELTEFDQSYYDQPVGSVTYMPPAENPFAEQDTGFFGSSIFSLTEWVQILGGILAMIGTTYVIREIELEQKQHRQELMNFDA